MAKQMISKNTNIKVVGILDKNENGEYFVTIEDKDNVTSFLLNPLLEEMVGTEISLSSVDELSLSLVGN
jgi:hypothetical protein